MGTQKLIEEYAEKIEALAVEYQHDLTQMEFKEKLKAVISEGFLAAIRRKGEK